jgi:hypothetical protein
LPRQAPARGLLCVLALLACSAAHAATVLEYRREGECATDFERIAIDGLHMRIDMRMDGVDMTSLIDDDEQVMHQVMHDSRTYMTMESDDDAVDFNSDVARSTLLNARNQARAATGLDNGQLIQRARDAQVAACPDMEGLGFGDPDYPEAASRCAETLAQVAAAQSPASRADAVAQARGRSPARRVPAESASATVRWSTTTLESETQVTEVAGHRCTIERIRRDTTVLREECLATIESLKLEPRAQRRLARLAKVGEGLGAGVVSLHPELQQEQRNGPPTISLRRTCYRDGRATGSAVLQVRTDVAVDPSRFELPAGYEPLRIELPSTQAPEEMRELLDGIR